MRLFESILEANHRAVAGDTTAGLHPADFAGSLPVVALTCIDPRLNAYFPNALGLPGEQFIWLRNAGNIITSSLSSTMRSLALACAVKGGREIAVIGHSDCQVCKTTVMALLEKLKAMGVDRSRLPDNVTEFFGMFGSERQNVIKACDFIRHSPLIGPGVPVHGLLLDLENGQLDWVVNGYEAVAGDRSVVAPAAGPMGALGSFKDFAMGELKFPETKIGEMAAKIGGQLAGAAAQVEIGLGQTVDVAENSLKVTARQIGQFAEANLPKPPVVREVPATLPPKKRVPLPPPVRPKANLRRS